MPWYLPYSMTIQWLIVNWLFIMFNNCSLQYVLLSFVKLFCNIIFCNILMTNTVQQILYNKYCKTNIIQQILYTVQQIPYNICTKSVWKITILFHMYEKMTSLFQNVWKFQMFSHCVFCKYVKITRPVQCSNTFVHRSCDMRWWDRGRYELLMRDAIAFEGDTGGASPYNIYYYALLPTM